MTIRCWPPLAITNVSYGQRELKWLESRRNLIASGKTWNHGMHWSGGSYVSQDQSSLAAAQ
jgi:hypothetical protein